MKRIFLSFFLFIMISMVGLQYMQPLLISKPLHDYYRKEYIAYWRDLTRGTFQLLLNELRPLAPVEQKQRIKQLQSDFGYPLTLTDSGDLHLTAAERQQLTKHLIVVKDNGEMFYRLIPKTDTVIAMGPVKDFAPSLQIDLLAWAVITLLFGLMALVWARPFWSKLKAICHAAQAFGQGDFSARAQLPQRSALAPLANTFNDMAGRIQQLISSHKELTRAVSHELRTPIARIRFALEMAHAPANKTDQRMFLNEISRDVDELDELVSELLTHARFDREAPGLRRENQLIAPWLMKTVAEVKPALAKVSVVCRIADDAQKTRAHIAPRDMARALNNLILNAGKYAEKQIVVSLKAQGDRCLIHVDDDGPGIPVAGRERIFEPFVRLDSSRSKETGGHGLGLAIVKQIITLHGGSVQVENSPLGGARFTLLW